MYIEIAPTSTLKLRACRILNKPWTPMKPLSRHLRFPGLASFEMQRPRKQITINLTMMITTVTILLLLIIIVLTLPIRCFVPMNLIIHKLFLFKTFLYFLTDQIKGWPFPHQWQQDPFVPGNSREFQLSPVIVGLLAGRKHGLLFFWFIDLLTYSETISQHLLSFIQIIPKISCSNGRKKH